jgi:hypothetical protein
MAISEFLPQLRKKRVESFEDPPFANQNYSSFMGKYNQDSDGEADPEEGHACHKSRQTK